MSLVDVECQAIVIAIRNQIIFINWSFRSDSKSELLTAYFIIHWIQNPIHYCLFCQSSVWCSHVFAHPFQIHWTKFRWNLYSNCCVPNKMTKTFAYSSFFVIGPSEIQWTTIPFKNENKAKPKMTLCFNGLPTIQLFCLRIHLTIFFFLHFAHSHYEHNGRDERIHWFDKILNCNINLSCLFLNVVLWFNVMRHTEIISYILIITIWRQNVQQFPNILFMIEIYIYIPVFS